MSLLIVDFGYFIVKDRLDVAAPLFQ
jgi:hypothetical protein